MIESRKGVLSMKKFVLFLVLAVIAAGGIFAQESYIKPTWGFGFASLSVSNYSETLAALSLDVDFVHSSGLTFGLQPIMVWNGDGTYPLTNFGLGYTYTAAVWSVGGKLMAIPFELGGGGIGFDVNGTYWFKETLGITGLLDLGFGVGDIDWTLFSLRVGISAKF
jgi:hypothetical protein